jgi:hypothetical protein
VAGAGRGDGAEDTRTGFVADSEPSGHGASAAAPTRRAVDSAAGAARQKPAAGGGRRKAAAAPATAAERLRKALGVRKRR